jgi:hypothetical protein
LGDPKSSIVCHCASCRRASAAPTVAWLSVDKGQFHFSCGSPRSFRSSGDVVRRFCEICGTQLTYESAASPNSLDVTTASLDDPDLHPPTMEVWLENKIAWQVPNESLDHHRRDPSEGHKR